VDFGALRQQKADRRTGVAILRSYIQGGKFDLARAFTFAPPSISSFDFSRSGMAIINAVVPSGVAVFGSKPS